MSNDEALTPAVILDAAALPPPLTYHQLPSTPRNGMKPMKKRRNAGGKRRRNAARPRPRPRNGIIRFGGGKPKVDKPSKPGELTPDTPLSWPELVWPVASSTGAALLSSWGAAALAHRGVASPKTLAWALGIGGGVASVVFRKQQRRWATLRAMAQGVASAGTSQVVLQWLSPDKPPPPSQSPPAPAAAVAPLKRNLEIGELPPHALEDAFRRAQAQLAITGDPYATTSSVIE